jgi:hypothetical protein
MEGGDDQGGVKGGERARGGSVSRIALGMRWADWDLQPAKRLGGQESSKSSCWLDGVRRVTERW